MPNLAPDPRELVAHSSSLSGATFQSYCPCSWRSVSCSYPVPSPTHEPGCWTSDSSLFTWSALFTRAVVEEPDEARLRLPRLDPERWDERFLRRAELIFNLGFL